MLRGEITSTVDFVCGKVSLVTFCTWFIKVDSPLTRKPELVNKCHQSFRQLVWFYILISN